MYIVCADIRDEETAGRREVDRAWAREARVLLAVVRTE